MMIVLQLKYFLTDYDRECKRYNSHWEEGKSTAEVAPTKENIKQCTVREKRHNEY